MSYILDALNKAEQQRQKEVIVASHHFKEVIKPTPVIWKVLAIIVLLLNGVIITYFLSKKDNQSSKEVMPMVAQKERVAQTTVQNIKITPVENKNEIKKIIKVIPHQIVNVSIETKTKTKTKPIIKHQAVSEDIIEKPRMTQVMAPVVIPPKENKLVIERSKIPLLQSKTLAFQQKIPKFTINVYVYNKKNPEHSYVLIDMERYQQAAMISEGLQLKQIHANSLVFAYHSEEFRMLRP